MQWVFFDDCFCDSLGRFTAALVATSFASNRESHEFLFLRSLNHVVGWKVRIDTGDWLYYVELYASIVTASIYCIRE